jgi:hypothetical protein
MKTHHTALLTACVIAALLTGWVLWSNTPFYFVDPALQVLDFASNDMLVVEAKKLSLLHGHYSRAGFYHPGPFYFYWMAGWEGLLHDCFPLFSSTSSVQHFAATLLMALAYGSFAFLTTQLSGNMLTGLASTAALFGLEYLSTGNVITAPWPPHMLVASSIFTVTGAAGLLLRGWCWLPLFCLGALQLLHGHASFFGLLLPIALPVLLLTIRHRGIPPLHSKSVWLATAIVAVMMAPLAVITLFNFPEPWMAYLQQAHNGEHISAMQAMSLLGSFLLPLPAAVPLLIAHKLPAVALRAGADTKPAALASGVIFCSGFVAAAWFALQAVDSLDNRYLLFWFAPFSALPGALAVVAIAGQLPRIGAAVLCVAVVAAASIGCRNTLPWMLHNSALYENYQQVWQRLQQLAQQGPVQIHTDNRSRYADIWSQLLTFIALGNRSQPAFCVAPESWQLSYHAASRCGTSPQPGTRHVLMTAQKPAAPGNIIAELDGIYYVQTELHSD